MKSVDCILHSVAEHVSLDELLLLRAEEGTDGETFRLFVLEQPAFGRRLPYAAYMLW